MIGLLQSSARYRRLMISSCALSAVQAEPPHINMEGLSAVWGIRREPGGRRQARGRKSRKGGKGVGEIKAKFAKLS